MVPSTYLAQVRTVYHVAPASARTSISAHGVDCSRAATRWSDGEEGFYAFAELDEAFWYAELQAHEPPVGAFDIHRLEVADELCRPDGGLSSCDEPTSAVHVGADAGPAVLVASYQPSGGWHDLMTLPAGQLA